MQIKSGTTDEKHVIECNGNSDFCLIRQPPGEYSFFFCDNQQPVSHRCKMCVRLSELKISCSNSQREFQSKNSFLLVEIISRFKKILIFCLCNLDRKFSLGNLSRNFHVRISSHSWYIHHSVTTHDEVNWSSVATWRQHDSAWLDLLRVTQQFNAMWFGSINALSLGNF